MAFESEVDDACQLIVRHSGVAKAFSFSKEDHPLKGPVGAIRYTVHVGFKDRDFTYEGGHGLNWLGEFERDLKAGWHGYWIAQP
ncbi:MAG: hypothetical protein JO006_09570 [Paucibacter sp.]|nr:hypothetical protein [Roseateles sp.]